MIREPVQLSLETYSTMIDKENLGEPHITLQGQQKWHSDEADRERGRRAVAELRSLGLAEGDRASRAFRETVALMQRPATEYYSFVTATEGPYTVRAAMTGRRALVIERRGNRIDVTPIRGEQLGARVAAGLPHVPAARVQSMNCHAEDYEALERGKELASSPSVRDAKRLRRLLDGISGQGELYAALRDDLNRRYRTTNPVPTWVDTGSGRVMISKDSAGWLTVVGADANTIAGKFSALEAALRRR